MISRGPSSCTILIALAGLRNAMAASVPHPCSCIVAFSLYSFIPCMIMGRMDVDASNLAPRQSVVLISSLPHRLRTRPMAPDVKCCLCIRMGSDNNLLPASLFEFSTSPSFFLSLFSSFNNTSSTPISNASFTTFNVPTATRACTISSLTARTLVAPSADPASATTSSSLTPRVPLPLPLPSLLSLFIVRAISVISCKMGTTPLRLNSNT
mmetsp:Transcript_14796/g.22145  ORF Transcript_14796/g.22145 Transcript_14796/m.22145 type:complete len:210 (+) Transcript_14796:536-1165(+)